MTQFWLQVFWPMITTLAFLAAVVNFGFAISRRQYPLVALVRGLAGFASLVLAIGIVAGKALQFHPDLNLQWQQVFIATGVFVFAVLWLPSYVERGSRVPSRPTIQQRAARPANATVRLKQGSKLPGGSTDEWVN